MPPTRPACSEFILVMPNAFTKYQGSMYSNSAAIGDWETFVARELVAWVDAHYRTLANPASRGLAGHSMGGYGTLRIAMKQPGVFSAIYAMSSCCLAPNPNPDPKMFERAAQVRTDQDIAAADFFTKALLASAAAWSPDPRKPPLYINLPVADGKLLPDIVSLWNANLPNLMVHQYLPALRTCKAIGIEAGEPGSGRDRRLEAVAWHCSRVTRFHMSTRPTRATTSTASTSGSRPGSCPSLRRT